MSDQTKKKEVKDADGKGTEKKAQASKEEPQAKNFIEHVRGIQRRRGERP